MGVVSRKQPLYDQLVSVFREKIENELEPGMLLPSERQISEQYGISRTTVRLAMAELESAGLVVRRHGKGTFVADGRRETTDLTRTYSFTEQMRSMGRTPETRVLEFGIVPAPRHIASVMGLTLGRRVFDMRRLRIADGVPMMIERSYLPVGEFVGLTRQDVETKPLYDVIEKDFCQVIRLAEEEFSASVARADEAELLGVAEGTAVLRLFRTTYNEHNAVIEVTRSVARADQFRYKVTHYRG